MTAQLERKIRPARSVPVQLLVSIGATPEGKKELVGLIDGVREAAEKSWRRLDGHNQLPKVILGDPWCEVH